MKINIDQYIFRKDPPELIKITKDRLKEIIDLGLEEVGIAQFGIPDVMSGLYIEMVWSYDDKDWKGYIDWIKDLIKTKNGKIS